MKIALALTFLILVPSFAFAANGSLYMVPNSGTYSVGDTFQVSVFANTDSAFANSAEADIVFDKSAFEVLAVSTAGSVLSLWSTEPTYSNDRGSVTFSGWASNTFRGPQNPLLTITVRALREGTHAMRISQGALLVSDGKGSNILTELAQGIYTVDVAQVVVASGQGGFVLGASTQTEDAIPERPQFTAYSEHVLAGDTLILKGTASPKNRLDVWITKESEKPYRERADSTSEGTFVYVSKNRLEEGSYRVWIEPYSETGVAGPSSETLFFDALPSGSAALAASYVSLASDLQTWVGLLLVLLGFVFGFIGFRFAHERGLI